MIISTSLVWCEEKRLVVGKKIQGTTYLGEWSGLKVDIINVNESYFKIKFDYIKGAYSDQTMFHSLSISEFTVGELVPVKVLEYEVGTKMTKAQNFWVHVPRQYKKLYITGINKFGNNQILDLTPYDNYVKARTGRKGLDDSEKPKVYLNSPKLTNNLYRTEELYVTLEGNVTDNLGVLFFEINGEKVKLNADGSYKKRIKLKLGTNSILLKTTDLNNNSQTLDAVFIRDEIIEDTDFSDVDFPTPTSNQNSNAIAVVFGIEEYRNAPNVSYAVNDADIFREYLIKRFGFKRKNIYLRLDEQATKGELDKVFSKTGWISRNASKSSDVIIYFSGHGAPDYESKETFLVPYDGDPNYATSTGYAINDIYKNLRDLDVKSVTIILDVCFSGSSRDNQPLLSDARPISIEIERGSIPENMLVFSAASGSEISSSSEQKKHGIFTYYFLKGLNGDADGNSDRSITATEMNKYLNSHVPSQAKTMGREQHPQLLGSDLNRTILSY